jgi:hypothetical protein
MLGVTVALPVGVTLPVALGIMKRCVNTYAHVGF